jgi:uncharacterized protein YraI
MKNKVITLSLTILTATVLLIGCGSMNNKEEATTVEEITDEENSTTEIETSTVEETTTEIETSTVEETPTEIETSTIDEYKTNEEEGTEDYTVEALNTTMYMNNNGRVRKGPSKDYEVIRTLSKGDAVQVTGKVKEADWYQVEIDNEKLYISGSLLSDTKPSDNNTTTTPSQTTPSTDTPSTDTPTPSTSPDGSNDGYQPDGTYIDPVDGSVVHPGDSGIASDGSVWHYFGPDDPLNTGDF